MREFTSAAALGGGGVVISRQRRKDEAGEKEQTSREDGPVKLKKILKNHVIYLGPAMESRLEHGHLDRGTYVFRTRIYFGTNVIELY